MKTFQIGIIPYLLTLFLCTALIAAKEKKSLPVHYKDLHYSEFSYQAPDPKAYRVELHHGAVAYLVSDTALPLIEMKFLFRSNNFPHSKEDVAALQMYSVLLKSGGTRNLSPDQLEDSLEFVAASLSAYLNDHQSVLSLDAIDKDMHSLAPLLGDVALNPRYDAAVFQTQKERLLDEIHHRFDTPNGIMGPLYERVMMGSHPSNWLTTESDLKALSLNHVTSFTGRGFALEKLVIAASGRFDKKKMQNILNGLVDRFARLKEEKEKKALPFRGASTPGVYIVDKDLAQATIKIGLPGVQRPNKDYYPLTVASYIFGGGGFASRLMTKVRSDEGLAYGVNSYVDSDYYRKGTLGVTLQTKTSTAAYAVKLSLEEMKRMAKEGVTDAELESAKDGLIRSLPSLFDGPFSTASIFAQSELWGRNLDHFKKFPEEIAAITKEQVQQIFAKYFITDSVRICVVGPKNIVLAEDKTNSASLQKFGKVSEITLKELETKENP